MNIHKSQLWIGWTEGTRVLTHPHLGMGLVFREHVSYRRHLTYDCRMGMGGRTVAAKQLLAAITGGGPARSLEVPPEYAAANDQVGVWDVWQLLFYGKKWSLLVPRTPCTCWRQESEPHRTCMGSNVRMEPPTWRWPLWTKPGWVIISSMISAVVHSPTHVCCCLKCQWVLPQSVFSYHLPSCSGICSDLLDKNFQILGNSLWALPFFLDKAMLENTLTQRQVCQVQGPTWWHGRLCCGPVRPRVIRRPPSRAMACRPWLFGCTLIMK